MLTMRVEFTAEGSSDVTWIITATYTGVATDACTVCMAGNPFWLDNLNAYYTTLDVE